MATDSTSGSKASARPSSSTSELFGGIYARGPEADAVSDHAWLQAMLDVEAALGGEPMRAEDLDAGRLGPAAADHASPVVPLAMLFEETHAGATSQDILDTAMMLVARRALEPLLADARAAADAAAVLADAHRHTPVMGRTLLQGALPTSFGLKAAGWMTLDRPGGRHARGMFAAMEQEHERAAGAWQAEWGTMTDLLRLTGSAAAWASDLVEHLEVDAAAMRAGAGEAPDLGAASELIDRALAAHRR